MKSAGPFLIFILALSSWAQAQSADPIEDEGASRPLGDVVREAKQKPYAKSSRVLTNDDLSPAAPARPTQQVDSPEIVSALIQMAFPDAQFDAKNQAYILASDSRGNTVRKQIDITNTIREQTSSGGTVQIAAFEVTVDQEAAISMLESYLPQAVSPSQAILAVAFADSKGDITATKIGKLDSAAVTHVGELYWPDIATDGVFPSIQVAYQAWYGGADWFGSVRWAATVDTSTMTIVNRLPTIIEKHRQSGSVVGDALVEARGDNGNITITGLQSGKTLAYQCSGTCIVDVGVLMDAW